MFKGKRGQGLSTSAIVLIILGVVVLVLLIVGFTMGWETLAPWISDNNVDAIATSCQVACSTGSTYDYCTKQITLKAPNLPGNVGELVANCSYFANAPGYEGYGIQKCTSVSCPYP